MKAFFSISVTKLLVLVFLTLNISILSACTEKKEDQKFEGYQVKFEYEKYLEEREIGYQFYLNEESRYLPDIEKKNIGIDLYDIDDDGQKEIFVYVNGGDRCPRAGCPFAVLKKVKVDEDMKAYKKIWWSPKGVVSPSIYETDSPRVLNSITLGYHDILFGKEGDQISIYVWKGGYYDTLEVIDY